MSKNYQKAAIRRIFALAVLIAGTCYIAATAWATTCFLPSGNCSTGRVGNEDKPNPDPTPGPGPEPVDACKDFKNNSIKSEYDWKSKTSCFECTTCTSNGNTKYKCENKSDRAWDSSDGGHCCWSGEKWYSKMGKCCSATSGCTCPTLQKWSNGECVCQYAKTTDGTCCKQGKIADKHLCCNAGEHAENTICCPVNKHEEGGSCVCDANYETDGTGCKPIDKCKGYDLTASQAAQYNTNCYACSQCGSNTAKYKCEVRTTPLNGYKLDNGTCKKEAKTYTIAVYDEVSYGGDLGKNIVRILRKVKCDNPKAVVTLKTELTYAAGMMTDGEMTDTFGPFRDAETSQERNYSFTCDEQSIDNACITYLNFTVDLDHNIEQTAIENNTPCAPMTITVSNGDTYNVACGTNEKPNIKTCASYKLAQEGSCKTGEIFEPSKTHPIDDYNNKCGTCKYNYFDIYLDGSPSEIYCSKNNGTRKYTRVSIYLTDEQGNKAKDIYGNTVAKITSSGARFTKGNYILNLAWEADDYSVIPYIEMMSLMPVSAAATTDKCWGNGQEALDSGCEKPLSVSGNSTAFKSSSYAFEAGDHYRVGYSYSSPKGVTCKKYK